MPPRLAFIGMSNIGKTRWARRMTADGYTHIDCDALIEKKLKTLLDGNAGLGALAGWMGMPYAPQYKKNSALYMENEEQVMRDVMELLDKDKKLPAIVDTTGSVIYTSPEILRDLRAKTCIIYFEASEAHAARLFKSYLKYPKPTIWRDIYAPQQGESAKRALKRCFPDLLRTRAELYKKMAHATLPYEKHRAREADIALLIKEYL